MPLSFPDWSEMSLYVYLTIGSVLLVFVSLGMNFATASRMKAPALLLGIVGGVGLGAAGAIIAMMGFGWRWYAQKYDNGTQMDRPGMPVNVGGAPMGQGGGPRGGGSTRGGGPGGGGPSSRSQLVSLITKLDLLTHERFAVKLDEEQKRRIREQIQKLEDKEDLTEEDAKTRLDAVVAILNDDQKKTLREAGASLPGQPSGAREGGRGGQNDAARERGATAVNPFREGQASLHLKSLRGELEEKKTQ